MTDDEGPERSALLAVGGVQCEDRQARDHPCGVGVDLQPPFPSVILVVIPMFMGYAALVSFQADIKDRIGIMHEGSSASYAFGEAVSLLFLAALLLRLLHNVVLSWLRPRQRVVLACVLMSVAVGVVSIAFYALQWKSLGLVFAVYIAGGIAVGTFEANVVSCITPLGSQTKKWAIMGMPAGYNGVSIGGFGLFALSPSNPVLQGSVFGGTGVCCILGMLLFLWHIPNIALENGDDDVMGQAGDVEVPVGAHTPALVSLWLSITKWREWVPPLLPNIAALFVDMFACILASTVALYIFKVGDVPLVPSSHVTIPYNAFQAAFNVCGFIGDFCSRKVAYAPPSWWPRVALANDGNPLRFVVLTAVGLALCLCKVAVLAPVGMLLIMFGNGMIYATTTRHIDQSVPWTYNLVALSLWLFTGDCGSYIASNLTTAISNAIGRVPTAS